MLEFNPPFLSIFLKNNSTGLDAIMQTKLNPEQTLLENWRSLDFDQQRQVLEFIQFLQFQAHQSPKGEKNNSISALEAAGDLVGCLQGPGDLSLEKRKLKQTVQ
jgi:hypothetical protein